MTGLRMKGKIILEQSKCNVGTQRWERPNMAWNAIIWSSNRRTRKTAWWSLTVGWRQSSVKFCLSHRSNLSQIQYTCKLAILCQNQAGNGPVLTHYGMLIDGESPLSVASQVGQGMVCLFWVEPRSLTDSIVLNTTVWWYTMYRQTSNTSRTSIGNILVDNSDVVGALPVGAAPTTPSLST